MQQAGNQLVTKAIKKRCLIGLQKGVSKGLKGHLLKAKRALIERQLMPFWFSILEFSLQDGRTEEDRRTEGQKETEWQNDRMTKNDRRTKEDRMTKWTKRTKG